MFLRKLWIYKSYNCKVVLRSVKSIKSFSSQPGEAVSEYEQLRRKIVYNSLLIKHDEAYLTYSQRKNLKYEALKRDYSEIDEKEDGGSIALKYLNDTPSKPKAIAPQNSTNKDIRFPFGNTKVVEFTETGRKSADSNFEEPEWMTSSEKVIKKLINDKNWLPHDPDLLKDSVTLDGESMNLKYGSANPSISVSDIPCGGCGAFLHCQCPSIPGFIPFEVFDGLNKSELKTLVCQRCHFLRDYGIALGVDVSPDDYPKILAPLKETKALVLLLVDLLDVPCSIWPGLIDIIGRKRPIVVVANKVDLLMQDGVHFFDNVRESLMNCLLDAGIPKANVKHIALISAKTGFGVESLITQLHESWRYQGDVYIVGCTNVGKSTLFNTLIQSDFCKVQAVDLMQRATVSEWPGTTLNLLKFPILRPSHWRLHIRKERMYELEKKELEEHSARFEALKRSRFTKQASLAGTVGRSFFPESLMNPSPDPFSVAISSNPRGVSPLGLNPNSKAFAESKWCYDTPGVVHPDQVLNILTTQEIVATVPKSLIVPRPFHLQPGYSLLIGGLARMDYLAGPKFTWFTVFATEALPITITKTDDVEFVYNELLGTEILQVPNGNVERLKKWPGLKSKTLEVCGKITDEVASDLVLSSAGWIAITMEPAEFCSLQAWTPDGKGIYLRSPFIKKAHRFRGSRIRKTPAFRPKLYVLNS